MRLARRVTAACLAVGLVVPMTATSYAESRHHKLERARHHAAVLDARAHHQAAQVAAMRAQLARLDAQANAALEALQRARMLADAAQAAADKAQARYVAAQHRTDVARQRLSTMISSAYQNVAAGGALANTLSLVNTGDPDQFLEGLQLIGQVGQSESNAVDDLRVAEAEQQRTQEIAQARAAAATVAEGHAADAKAAADKLVARQHVLLGRERTLLAHTRTAAAASHAKANRIAHAIAVARERAAAIRRAEAAAAARRAAAGAAMPKCDGGSVAGYPNGELPISALCPLWGAPGEMLQAPAAAAFNRMSQAFSQAFGEPLCVTSSYRTYAKQVYLYATMPAGYAAVPGTSNHGWGLAVDLCGGIQVDSSPEHIWLLDHASSFSWFHPAWAMPGGPGPHEPWHWEYAG